MYPFKIGTTSYIYPAGYVDNVKILAPCLDEIELLLLESAESDITYHMISNISVLPKSRI